MKTMREILEEKLKAFKASYFENKEFKTWLKESNLWMAAFTCLRLQGIEMDKKELVSILDGKIIENVPLDLYGLLHSFKDLYKDMQACIGMQQSLDSKLINRFYKMIISGEGYRHTNPVVFKWGFVPPHFNSIEDEINDLCKVVEKMPDPIDRALKIHLGLCSIYPYGEDTAIMATIAMYYQLMLFDIPLPSFTVDDEEYNRILSAYLSNGENYFDDMFYRSAVNRLDSVIMYGTQSQER